MCHCNNVTFSIDCCCDDRSFDDWLNCVNDWTYEVVDGNDGADINGGNVDVVDVDDENMSLKSLRSFLTFGTWLLLGMSSSHFSNNEGCPKWAIVLSYNYNNQLK